MSNQCIEAKKTQTCSRCGRHFTNNELILADQDGDITCYGHCWRTLPAKARPATVIPMPIRRTPVVKEPVLAETTNPTDEFGSITDILRKGITEAVKELRKE